jgi:prepilin-type N-terminal cleavage/methylation domain-containing protein
MSNQNSKNSSFTLIEILVVLALIAILSTVLILIIKPGQIFSRARDTKRINDLKNIEKIMDTLYATDQTFNELNYLSPNVVYISLPDSSSTCGSWLSQLPSLPSGWSYRCSANPTNIDGSGWIPIPFNSFPILNISQLPIDPRNQPPYYYSFVVGGSYAVYGQLEDPKHQASKNDGDNYPHLFSAGNNKRLIDQAQGLVGYWPFDEGSGTIAKDYSGNGNNGTLVNGPTWTTGKVGGALIFDGVDDYVRIPRNILDPNKAFTFEAWVIPRSTAARGSIINFGGDPGAGCITPWLDMVSGGNIIFGLYKTGSQNINITSNFTIPANQPVHVVTIYNMSKVRIYINGVIDKSSEYNFGSQICPNVYIGGNVAYNQLYFNGVIDNVRIYNRALSDSEIKALYESTK